MPVEAAKLFKNSHRFTDSPSIFHLLLICESVI